MGIGDKKKPLQQLSGAEEVYGWEYECGTGKREYYRIGHRYAVGFEEEGCFGIKCPKKDAYCGPQQNHNGHNPRYTAQVFPFEFLDYER